MKFRYIKSILSAASLLLAVSVTSCIGDLDATPIDPNIVMTFDQASVFNKIYGTLGLTGQKGPDGSGDLDDIDEGTSSFYRMTWCANQLMTDEAIVNSWNDAGVATIADCSWSSSNEIVTGLYYRLTFDITLCNYFLEQTEGLTDDETTRQRAEVRFIRALNNYYLMDMFGNPPYCDKVSTEKPQQIQRADLFAKIEEELKEIGDDATATLAQPLQTTYGRVDRVAAWLLLARMYLNAEVYTSTPQWGKAKEYAQKVIGSGYKLARQAGHTIVPPQPSLCSLVSPDPACRQMMGLSLRNVTLTLLKDGKPLFTEQGEALFTHFGISGPLVLSASTYIDDVQLHRYIAEFDLKPALDEKTLYDRLTRDFAALGGHSAQGALEKLLPNSMRPVAVKKWGVDPATRAAQITREQKMALVHLCKHWQVPISELGDLQHAVITAGGVDTKEVDPKTMQSKLCAGLYFAGEVLDVDARTGGYNLQIAWATAQAAVRAIGNDT